MKLLFTLGALGHGGGERVVSVLANRLVKEGHEVGILLYYDREIWYPLDESVKVTVEEREIGKKGILAHLSFKRKFVKRTRPDAVISFLAPFNMISVVALLGLKTPLIVADRNDPHHVPSNPVIRRLRDLLYRFADGVVLQTVANRNYFSKCVQKKSAVIYNPVDLGSGTGTGLGVPKEKQIVTVGRLMRQKNQDMLIDAFVRFAEVHPDHRLIIYGEGEYRPELEKHIADTGMSDRIDLPGSIKNVPEYIKTAEFFVLSSDYEGMPNALIEAMCVGLPVISTAVSGATDLIKDGENGLLVGCGDTDALASAMTRMADDHDLRERTSSAASSLAERLTVEKITAEWLDFVNKIASLV